MMSGRPGAEMADRLVLLKTEIEILFNISQSYLAPVLISVSPSPLSLQKCLERTQYWIFAWRIWPSIAIICILKDWQYLSIFLGLLTGSDSLMSELKRSEHFPPGGTFLGTSQIIEPCPLSPRAITGNKERVVCGVHCPPVTCYRSGRCLFQWWWLTWCPQSTVHTWPAGCLRLHWPNGEIGRGNCTSHPLLSSHTPLSSLPDHHSQ